MMGQYLMHFGIKGQKWGVRRFQNEDGTLTEEGKKRYIDSYNKAEEQAEKDIKRAESQIEDIKKNGWNAKSAFDPKFVKEYAKDLGMKKPPEEDLDTFLEIFKNDLKDAKLNKKAAQEARSFIESNNSLTFDEVLDELGKIDKSNKVSNLREAAKAIGKELGLERTTHDLKSHIEYDEDDVKIVKDSLSNKEIKEYVDYFTDIFKSAGSGAENVLEYLKGKPPAEQYLIISQLLETIEEY